MKESVLEKPCFNAQKTHAELLQLGSGVADTSTLIYLEQVQLLQKVTECFQLLLPVGVVEEFGDYPAGCTIYEHKDARTVDQAVIELARAHNLPVFSEDRQILNASGSLGLKYYNTLMLLLALLLQKKIDLALYEKAHSRLQKNARYSPAVWQAGEKVFSLYVR